MTCGNAASTPQAMPAPDAAVLSFPVQKIAYDTRIWVLTWVAARAYFTRSASHPVGIYRFSILRQDLQKYKLRSALAMKHY
jgi:hypothetical protein